jgi:hypothetical protein
MPTVTCPSCQKHYKLPDSAAGQVASCKCGKKFRIAMAAPVAAAAAATPAAAAQLKPQRSLAARAELAKPSGASSSDDFWDKALSEPIAVEPPAALKPAPVLGSKANLAPPDRRRRDEPEAAEPKVRWGFDWGKVFGGLATFVIAGGITAFLVVSTGYLYFWPAGIAVVGLLTALAGLMGEEGIW